MIPEMKAEVAADGTPCYLRQLRPYQTLGLWAYGSHNDGW